MTQSLSERLSNLSLPELSRDDITRGLSGLHVPDLSDIERPTIDLPEIDLRKIDLPNAVHDVATAVGLERSGRPRWQFALGAAALLAAGAFVVVNRRAVQMRIDAAMLAIERRFAQLRSARPADEPVAFPAASTAPIEPSDPTGETGSDYPDGLGNGAGPAVDNGIEPRKRSAEVVGV